MAGAFFTNEYRNYFAELGYSQAEIDKRVNDTFNTMFYGLNDERVYFPWGDDMAYIVDTGNGDVRTEGMSYGMMICVQLDKKHEFDRLWKWTKTNMYFEEGVNEGYFCWSNSLSGSKNSNGPAPDGEEYFAMALIFASKRWGDGEGIFNYMQQAKELLHVMLHKGEADGKGKPMWNIENKLIKFITESEVTDPSYHLPHFYELFALYANECDREFWHDAAEASRKYLKLACHKETGLCAEFAEYDGTPYYDSENIFFYNHHDYYFSDAYRTVANIAMDWSWFEKDENEVVIAQNVQKFFCETVKDNPYGIYTIDGVLIDKTAHHPIGMMATIAEASLASNGKYAAQCAQKLWDTPLRKGNFRYYDNFLYMFAMLALSGNYRIY